MGDGDTDDGDDHLVENNGEGVANATTGTTTHKWKGLVVTEKEDEKEPKMFNYFQFSNFNSQTYNLSS